MLIKGLVEALLTVYKLLYCIACSFNLYVWSSMIRQTSDLAFSFYLRQSHCRVLLNLWKDSKGTSEVI